MKKYLLTLSLLPLAVFNSQAHAAKIYTCEVNGSIVYTSRPSSNCQAVNDLPIVGKYSSSRYDAPVSDAPTLNAPTSQTAPAKSKNTAAKSNHKQRPNLPLSALLLKRLLLRFQNPPVSTAAALFWKPSYPMNARLWPMPKSN